MRNKTLFGVLLSLAVSILVLPQSVLAVAPDFTINSPLDLNAYNNDLIVDISSSIEANITISIKDSLGNDVEVFVSDEQTSHIVIVDTTSGSYLDGQYQLSVTGFNSQDESEIGTSKSVNFVIDNTAPLISNMMTADITSDSATISWTTNEQTTGTLDYGITTNLGSLVNTVQDTTHAVSLSNLDPETTYYYDVTSCDSADNCAIYGLSAFITEQEVTTQNEESTTTTNEKKKTQSKTSVQSPTGAPIVTKAGIYSHLVLNKPRKILVMPSTAKRVIATLISLTYVDEKGEDIEITLAGKVFDINYGQVHLIDFDDDGITDISVEMITMVKGNRVTLKLKSARTVILPEGMTTITDTGVDVVYINDEGMTDFEDEGGQNQLLDSEYSAATKNDQFGWKTITLFVVVIFAVIGLGVYALSDKSLLDKL